MLVKKSSIIIKKQERKAGMSAGIELGRLEERAKIVAEKKRIAEEKHALELKLQTILEDAHKQACHSARMMLEVGVDKTDNSITKTQKNRLVTIGSIYLIVFLL